MIEQKTIYEQQKIILDRLDFRYSLMDSSYVFNITFGIDKNFLYGCGIAIASITINNPHINFNFHVFTDCFPEINRQKFEQLAKDKKINISIYLINCEHLKNLPNSKNWTYATYFRFIIADYFCNKAERILYLDADIACKGNLQPLQELTFDQKEIAAVIEENDSDWWENRAKQLGIPDLVRGYFNAGVLLINLAEWSKYKISEKALQLLNDPDTVRKITHLDQDILNILLINRVKYIDIVFNTRFSLNYMLKKSPLMPDFTNSVIVHYIGPTKPWHKWASYPCSKYFLDAKKSSPWWQDALLGPSNVGQWRYAAKHMIKQRKYCKAALNYIVYFKAKIWGK